jgi:hypothetical protein
MTSILSLLVIHAALAVWATKRSSRIARWAGARYAVALAFAWLLPLVGPVAALAATIGTGNAGDQNLRHAVEQLSDGSDADA